MVPRLTCVSFLFLLPAISWGQWDLSRAMREWSQVPSTAFFNKPTTLLEHRAVEGLRGIVSTRRASVSKARTFSAKTRLREICANIPKSYATQQSRVVVHSKVIPNPVPHCRLRVQEGKDFVEQVFFVSASRTKAGIYHTQTVTFFFPKGVHKQAISQITRFVGRVRKSDG